MFAIGFELNLVTNIFPDFRRRQIETKAVANKMGISFPASSNFEFVVMTAMTHNYLEHVTQLRHTLDLISQ